MLILFALEKTCGQLLTNLPYNFKERKVHDQFTQASKDFLRPKNDNCIFNEELLWTAFSDWKERKVHNQFTQAGKIFSDKTDAFICNEELLWTTLCDLIW